jgi:Ran GTPase-activating protein (RanGAP) involved in mRNA processing and transport
MKVLRVEAVRAAGQACLALMDALKDGACPHLTILSLDSTGFGALGAQRLADAIETRALPRLEELDVSRCSIRLEGATALAAALRTGGAPELQKANVGTQYGVGRDTAKALRADILEGCPRLRKGDLRMPAWRDH